MSAIPANVLHLLERDDYGPLLASALLTFGLWGMLYMQVYNYYSSDMSTKDRPFLKITIGVAAILECWMTFIFTHITYFYMVYNFGNPAELAIRPWTLNSMFAFREIQLMVIRCLLLRRLYILSNGTKIIIVWILLWSLVELSSEFAETVEFFRFGPILTYPKSIYTITYVATASVLVADISLAAALCYYLHKSRTGTKRTDSVIQLFILYFISTTALVLVVACVAITLFLVMGSNYLSFPCFVIQTKLYFMAYMVTLNNRDNLRSRLDVPETIDLGSFTPSSTQIIHSGGRVPSEKPTFSNIAQETYRV